MGFCKECKRWVPDAFVTLVGTCDKKDRPTLFNEGGCEFYSCKEEGEFMWCEDCRTTVHKSELEKHKGHCLYAEVRVDADASEYIPAGD